jgi:hypothetical protein
MITADVRLCLGLSAAAWGQAALPPGGVAFPGGARRLNEPLLSLALLFHGNHGFSWNNLVE